MMPSLARSSTWPVRVSLGRSRCVDSSTRPGSASGSLCGVAPRLRATSTWRVGSAAARRPGRRRRPPAGRVVADGELRPLPPQHDQAAVERRASSADRRLGGDLFRGRRPRAEARVPVVKPASRLASHCMGVRSGSRPSRGPAHSSRTGPARVRRDRARRACRSRRRSTGSACRAGSGAASPPRAPAPAPTRLAIRGLSWLPRTQFGQPHAGSAAS